ncbi:MAG: discoidin domain-containing protein [Streptosporangiales bacterium]|nr:discoidin domain-containing protein [Streptosporangiales bacterium]MBO0891210.1 discoidin domain-containing protein [Acidothermales bacterium]
MPEHTSRHPRRVAASLLAPVLAAALVVATVALLHRDWHSGTSADTSARALVVSANLEDAIRPADAADTRDLDTFVHRLVASTPNSPDVLLLTEVLGPGASRIADELTAATGDHYLVLAAPGDTAFLPDAAVRESAIVLNTTTMRVAQPGKFVRVQSEDEAYAVVARKGTDLELPVVSAHAAGDPVPATAMLNSVVSGYKSSGDPSNVVPVLGGDYRTSRCLEPRDYQAVDCAAQSFWNTLTTTDGYDDALFDGSGAETQKRSSYVFARGSVTSAHVDTAYDNDLPDRAACKDAFDAGRSGSASAACRSAYYADEPFGWAVLTARQPVQRSVAPSALTLDHCELGVRKSATLARVVNNTDADVTDAITASATAPLQVTPDTGSLTVPAGQARTLPLRVTAPEDTDVGTAEVTVHIGSVETKLAVSVPARCTESLIVATSYHSGFPPENAIDGDIDTFWHSEYSPPTPLPQSITLNLQDTEQVSKLTYQPRFDGNLNGTIRDYNVYVSPDGQSFTKVASGTWPVDARLKTATFDPVDARYVRLEATSASGGSFCSAAEINVS